MSQAAAAQSKRNPFTLLNNRFHGEKVSEENALKDLLSNPLKRTEFIQKTVDRSPDSKSNLRKDADGSKTKHHQSHKTDVNENIDLSEKNGHKKLSIKRAQSFIDSTIFKGLDLMDMHIVKNSKQVKSEATGSDYIALYYSYGPKCLANPSFYNIIPANVCIQSRNVSYFYSGDQYQLFNSQYSDTECGTLVNQQTLPLGCLTEGSSYYYYYSDDAPQAMSGQFLYVPGATSLPVPTIGNYLATSYFETDSCTSAVQHTGELAEVCHEFSSTSSYYINSSLAFNYFTQTANCTGPSVASLFSTDCAVNDDYTSVPDDNYYGLSFPYMQYSFESASTAQPDVTGYLVVSESTDSTCTSANPTPFTVAGYAINVCQPDPLTQVSYKFFCSNGYAYKYVYKSGDCDVNTQAFIEKQPLGCNAAQADPAYQYDDYNYYPTSTTWQCTTDSSVYLPSSNSDYAVSYFYDISNCGGSPVNYDSLVNNQCVALSDTESIKAVYPEFYFYASKDCTGPEESFPYFVGSTCTATDFSTGRKLVETEAAMPTYYDVFPMGYYTTSAEVQVQASATAEVSSGSSVAATDASSIAGIVIGVVLGFGLVGAALYYMLRRNGKAGEEEAVPLNEK